MATRHHILRATDAALKAFFEAASITGLSSANIRRVKEYTDLEFPVLVCNAGDASRTRAKNWAVTGTIDLKTTSADDVGEDGTAMSESDAMELAVLDALEVYIPDDDRPHPLGAAIQAAAVAADVIDSDHYLMTDCRLTDVGQGADADGAWTFSIGFKATVIFATT